VSIGRALWGEVGRFEFDKQVLVCTLLGCVIKRGLLKEVMG